MCAARHCARFLSLFCCAAPVLKQHEFMNHQSTRQVVRSRPTHVPSSCARVNMRTNWMQRTRELLFGRVPCAMLSKTKRGKSQ